MIARFLTIAVPLGVWWLLTKWWVLNLWRIDGGPPVSDDDVVADDWFVAGVGALFTMCLAVFVPLCLWALLAWIVSG